VKTPSELKGEGAEQGCCPGLKDFDPRKIDDDENLTFMHESTVLYCIVWPQVLVQLMMNGSNVVDIIFLGHIGKDALSAYGKAFVWLRLFDIIIRTMCSGIAILSGEDGVRYKPDGMRIAAGWFARGLVVAGVGTVAVSFATFYLQDLVEAQCTATGSAITYQVQALIGSYGHLVWAAAPATYLGSSLWDLASSTVLGGHSIPVMSSALALVFGILFNYGFIYGGWLTWIDNSWTGFNGSPLATVVTAWLRLAFTMVFFAVLVRYRAGDMQMSEASDYWHNHFSLLRSWCGAADCTTAGDTETRDQGGGEDEPQADMLHQMCSEENAEKFRRYLLVCGQKFVGFLLQSAFVFASLLIASQQPDLNLLLEPPSAHGGDQIISEKAAEVWDHKFGVHLSNHQLSSAALAEGNRALQPFISWDPSGSAVSVAVCVLLLTVYQIPLTIFNGIAAACANRVAVALAHDSAETSRRAGRHAILSSGLLALLHAAPFAVLLASSGGLLGRIVTQDSTIQSVVGDLDQWLAFIILCDAITVVINHGVFPEIQCTSFIPILRVIFIAIFAPCAASFSFALKLGMHGWIYAWAIASSIVCLCTCVLLALCWRKWNDIYKVAQAISKKHRLRELLRRTKEGDSSREPILEGERMGWAQSMNAHNLKVKQDETALTPDYIQFQRDAPHMMALRAAGGMF